MPRPMRSLPAMLFAALILVAVGACGDDDQGDGDGQIGDQDVMTVADLLAGGEQDQVAVRGMLFDDGTGLVLCDVLAESFPPQCPGDSLAPANPDEIDAELTAAEGVRWSERPYTLLGDLGETGFEVTTAEPG